MKKPCNRAFAITAGSIFLFAGLTLTILTIINLVQTLLSLFNGYSLPNQNVFINLLTITGYFLFGAIIQSFSLFGRKVIKRNRISQIICE